MTDSNEIKKAYPNHQALIPDTDESNLIFEDYKRNDVNRNVGAVVPIEQIVVDTFQYTHQ